MTMKGQVCVVTGASRGIGRGIALQLCQAGATVYITGRHLDFPFGNSMLVSQDTQNFCQTKPSLQVCAGALVMGGALRRGRS